MQYGYFRRKTTFKDYFNTGNTDWLTGANKESLRHPIYHTVDYCPNKAGLVNRILDKHNLDFSESVRRFENNEDNLGTGIC